MMTPREIFALVAGLQGLLLILLLISRKQNQIANRLLAVFVFIVFLQILVKTFESRELYTRLPFLYLLPFDLYFLLGPILYGYVRCMALQARQFKWIHLLYSIPFFIALGQSLPYMLMEPEEKFSYWVKAGIYTHETWDIAVAISWQLIGACFAWIAYNLLKRSESNSTGNGSLVWLKHLVFGLMLCWTVGLFIEIGAYYVPGPWVNWIYWYNPQFFCFIILIYLISFRAVVQPRAFDGEPSLKLPAMVGQSSYKRSGLSKGEASLYLQQLQEYMQHEKPYLDCDLDIEKICCRFGLSKHNLSQVLNTCLGKNFYAFINEYRIEETLRLLNVYQNKSLLEIAFEAGFNSKASFNRVFKSKLGQSPSQFRKELQSELDG